MVPEAYYREPENPRRPRIDEVLEQGKPIVVQVPEGRRGQQGRRRSPPTCRLAGRYLVLTPFDDTRGVSRKVEDEETRTQAAPERRARSRCPTGAAFIVRTNALDQNKADAGARPRGPAAAVEADRRPRPRRGKRARRLLYSDQDLILRALRDHLDASIEEILVDDDDAFDKRRALHAGLHAARQDACSRATPSACRCSRASTSRRRSTASTSARVPLPTGGSIVIDRTEALTAIDVNSGRATKRGNQEETALNTNLEAAREVARQLRLRDIGGLVVVDFIDMRAPEEPAQVEKELKDAMKDDKARSSVGRISANGLLEINRQRIQQALDRRAQAPCAHCEGSGRVPAEETVFQQILRRIEARAAVAPIRAVKLALHPEVAEAFRQSRKRDIAALERQFGLRVEIQPTRRVAEHAPEFEWVDRDRNDPGPHPPWTETALAEEVRWHAPLVPGPGDLPLAAAQRPSHVGGAARRETPERRGARAAPIATAAAGAVGAIRAVGARATAPNAVDDDESAIKANPRCSMRCPQPIEVSGASRIERPGAPGGGGLADPTLSTAANGAGRRRRRGGKRRGGRNRERVADGTPSKPGPAEPTVAPS